MVSRTRSRPSPSVRRPAPWLAAALVAASPLGTACYRAVPVAPAAVAALTPGAAVRLYLSPQGTTDLAPRLGPETIAVDGTIDSVGANGIALVVSRTTKSFGGTIPWIGERVTIPTGAVAHAERRALDRRRTVVVAASTAVAAGAALVALIAQHGAGSGTEGGGGVTPTP